jgi:hypothetical protein
MEEDQGPMTDGIGLPYGVIWQQLKAGKVIPFLGAGASLSGRAPGVHWVKGDPASPPTAGELGTYLAEQGNFPGEPAGDLAKVAQYFGLVSGRPVLRTWLNDIFACPYPPNVVHEFLADLPAPLLIVTTNYDDLLERAFQAKGRAFDLVIYTTDNPEWSGKVLHWRHGAEEPDFPPTKKLQIDMEDTTVIFKMHGGIDRDVPDRSSFVVSEDDYTDFLVRVASKTAVPPIFAELVRTRHFLFLGYGLRDWNLRVVLSKIDKDLPRPPADKLPSWAIQKDSTALERELWKRRGISIHDMDLHEFIDRLQAEKRKDQ